MLKNYPATGGSLRVYGCHSGASIKTSPAVGQLLEEEELFGLKDIKTYLGFKGHVNQIKNAFLEFLIAQKKAGKTVAAYGAAAKGNTLINYAGVKSDLIPYICDAAKAKQGKYLPGSHIPILPPEKIKSDKPDFVLIVPWNIKSEVLLQLQREIPQKTEYVVALPSLSHLN